MISNGSREYELVTKCAVQLDSKLILIPAGKRFVLIVSRLLPRRLQKGKEAKVSSSSLVIPLPAQPSWLLFCRRRDSSCLEQESALTSPKGGQPNLEWTGLLFHQLTPSA